MAQEPVDPRQERIEILTGELEPGEVEFCYAYVESGYNGRKAVESCPSWNVNTPDSAYVQASRLLRNAKIKELVALIAEMGFVEARVSVVRIIDQLAKLAFFDIRNYFDEDGRMKRVDELTEDEAAAIVGIEEIVTGFEGKGEEKRALTTTKYKLANKERCLELLGKYHKIFSDMMIDVKVDLASEIIKARRRLKKSQGGADEA